MRASSKIYPLILALLLASGPARPCAKKVSKLARATLRTDFHTDVANEIRNRLAPLGVVVPATATSAEALRMSFSYQHRRPRIQPWKVELAPGLAGKTLPQPIREGLEQLIAKAKNGEDLVPHMSKRIGDPEYNDGLFNDWRIYHFHLGKTLEANSNFITRTNELAFVIQKGDTLYVLDVLPHAGSFTDFDLLQTAHRHFPQTISDYQVQGLKLTPETLALSRDESLRPKLRRFGLNVGHQMDDGTVYMSPGGGFSVGGGSADVSRRTMLFQAWIDRVEDHVAEIEPQLRKHIAAQGKIPPKQLKVRLIELTRKELLMVEENTGLQMRLPLGS